MGDYITSSIYPFAEIYNTGYAPHGCDAASKEILTKAWNQFAAILQSGADAVGVSPQQISIFLSYERPVAPKYREALYASSIGKKYGITLSGDIDLEKQLKEAAIEAVKESIVEGVAMSIPGGGVAKGALTVGVNLISDKDMLKTKEGQMAAAKTAASTVPGVAGAAIQVGLTIVDSRKMLSTTEGRTQTAIQAGFIVASFIPVVNVIAIGAQAVMAAVTASKMHKMKEHIKAEIKRAEHFTRMIKSYINIAVNEARELVATLADRGIVIRAQPTADFSSGLRQHYDKMVFAKIEEANDVIRRAKAKWYVKQGQNVLLSWSSRHKFDVRRLTFKRRDHLRIFLQLARDMRKVNQALKLNIRMKGSQWKDAQAISMEIRSLAAAMLAKDPTMPIQTAMNIAAGVARKSKEAIDSQVGEVVATKAVQKVEAVKKNDNLASLGMMAAFAAIKFLK